MSAKIKGQQYQLAGFEIAQRGTLVKVFAKFCRADQDPANLPTRATLRFGNASVEMSPIYPSVSPEDIVKALIGPTDISEREDSVRLPGNADEVVSDLGAENAARLLVEMGRTKREYLARTEWLTTFIPVPKGPTPSQK